MQKYLFFVLMLLSYEAFSIKHTAECAIAPLIDSNNNRDIVLESDNTKTILRYTLAGPSTLGQKSFLSSVCKSWQTFCAKDTDIIDHINTVKKFNTVLIQNIFAFHNYYSYFHTYSENELIEITTYPLFDVRYTCTENINARSLLIYSIEKKQYSLFETLLNHSYILIRPTILEKIIVARDIRFIELLKKYSFHFNRYHFAYSYISYVLHDETRSSLNCKVTYSQKRYSEKHAEKLLRWIIKKTLFYYARNQQLNEKYLKQ